MTADDADAGTRPIRPARRRRGRVVLIAAVVGVGVVALVAAGLYANRRVVAREVLVGWLDRRGVPARVEVERIDLTGFVASVSVGPQGDPDVSVQRVEVDYAVGTPWSAGGFGVRPSEIRVIRPIARATWRNGVLSLGTLDPLIEELRRRPPDPDADGPTIVVRTGRLRLTTDYGPLQVLGDARLEDGRLVRLIADMPAASLRSGSVEARGLGGRIDLASAGERLRLDLSLTAQAVAVGATAGETLTLRMRGDLPYPDPAPAGPDRGVRGAAALDARVTAAAARGGGVQVSGLDAALDFSGRFDGWIDRFVLDGIAALDIDAARLTGGPAGRDLAVDGRRLAVRLERRTDGSLAWSAAGDTRLAARFLGDAMTGLTDLSLRSPDLRLSGQAGGATPGAVQMSGTADLSAGSARSGDLRLAGLDGRITLALDQGAGARWAVRGRVSAADGAWPLFGPIGAEDPVELARLKTALGDFSLSAPDVRLAAGPDGVALTLARPLQVRPANGGLLSVQAAGGPALRTVPSGAVGGAMTVVSTPGRGLPDARFQVTDWRLIPGGFQADLNGTAAFDFATARGVDLTTAGRLVNRAGVLTYAGDCAAFAVERLDLDPNAVEAIAGRFCPQGSAPLVRVADGRWRAFGAIQAVEGQAPFLQLAFDQARGRVTAVGGPDGLGLEAEIASARVADTTRPRRFNDLIAAGTATLADERWGAGFDLSLAPSSPGAEGAVASGVLGRLALEHDGTTGRGGIDIAVPAIVFTEDGLQPGDLTPLVADLIEPPATGRVAFDGRLDWTPEGGTSRGVLQVQDLAFASPAGAVSDIDGRIVFDSLTPLVTAPDQALRVGRLDSVTPLTDLDVVFDLDARALTIDAGVIQAAGGRVRVEPFAVPLDPDEPVSGVIVFEGVQLGDLIAGAGFGDRVTLDARVSGRLPFVWNRRAGPSVTGLTIQGGSLSADGPGRLSIQREALSDIQAGGAGDALAPNTVQDLAYQAMENLAFDILTAEVDSAEGGRLNLLFRIRGRHDPPQRQDLRIGVVELLTRRFLNRELPLPSGTQIDLTLDTSLNAAQLISDLLAVNRARAGEGAAAPDAGVQDPFTPPAAQVPPTPDVERRP